MSEPDLPPVTLVLGGAGSGKSRHAERLIDAAGGRRLYIATAEAGDSEMAERIRRHRARRGDGWVTMEEPVDLLGALRYGERIADACLVDCLTLWLSNLMALGRDIEKETETLVQGVGVLRGPMVLVSNEVGQGIVPDNALARAFRDHAGGLHAAIAAVADRVDFVTAGLVQRLK